MSSASGPRPAGRRTEGRAAGRTTRRDESASVAAARRRRSAGQRLARTIVFGAVAVVAAIAWVSREMGLDRQELLGYAGASLMLILGFAVLGVCAGALLWLLRRARTRRDSGPGS